MRVLHVAAGDLYGGIERMLATLAATKSDAVAQRFAVSPAGRLSRELQEIGAVPVPLRSARASRPLSVLAARRAFAQGLTDARPDAVVCHGSWTHAMFAAVARERGSVLVFWQHAPVVQPHWPDRWASRTQPDIAIANSRFTATAPVFPGVPTHVIHCPVPAPATLAVEARRAGRAALGARDGDVVVFMAARLEAWKGHAILIEAARSLSSAAVKIWIAGGVQRAAEQPYFDRLAAAVVAHGLRDSVSLLGERTDVAELLPLADVYCQPNTAPEPFGIAIAEAMRAGLPCVVSNNGGAVELVDAECGILTEPGDVDGVSRALSQLAADPGMRAAFGRAAAKRAATMTEPTGRLAELAAALRLQPVHAH